MGLNEEVRIDESTSKRSQTTGRLLIVMPKMSAENCVTVAKLASCKEENVKMPKLQGTVSIRDIVVDESEVPPLI